jgi:hypothetical protein
LPFFKEDTIPARASLAFGLVRNPLAISEQLLMFAIDSGYCTSQPDSGSGDETPKDGDQAEHSVNSAGDELPPTADQSPEPELAKDDDFWAVSKKDKKKKKKGRFIWDDGPAEEKREED